MKPEDQSLLKAVQDGNIDGVRDALRRGAQINCRDEQGLTLLHVCIASDNNTTGTKLMDELLLNGLDINNTDERKWTPLHMAVDVGDIDAINFLLEKGGALEIPDINGFTPLFLAVSKMFREIIDILVINGADIYAKDKNGRTVIAFAEVLGQTALAREIAKKYIGVRQYQLDGLKEMQLQIENLTEDLSDSMDALMEKDKYIRELTDELREVKAHQDQLKEIPLLKAQIATLEEELRGTKLDYTGDSAQRLIKKDDIIRSLNERLALADKQIKSLGGQAEKTNRKIVELQNTLDDTERRYQKRIALSEKRLKTAEFCDAEYKPQELTDKESIIRDLTDRLALADEKIGALSTEVEELRRYSTAGYGCATTSTSEYEIISDIAIRAIRGAIDGLPLTNEHPRLRGIYHNGRLNPAKEKKLQDTIINHLQTNNIFTHEGLAADRKDLVLYFLSRNLQEYLQRTVRSRFFLSRDVGHIHITIAENKIDSDEGLKSSIDAAIRDGLGEKVPGFNTMTH